MHQNQNSKLIMPNPKDKKENSCVLNGRIFYWIREKVYFFLELKVFTLGCVASHRGLISQLFFTLLKNSLFSC